MENDFVRLGYLKGPMKYFLTLNILEFCDDKISLQLK
jgi:hypothetical protein